MRIYLQTLNYRHTNKMRRHLIRKKCLHVNNVNYVKDGKNVK